MKGLQGWRGFAGAYALRTQRIAAGVLLGLLVTPLGVSSAQSAPEDGHRRWGFELGASLATPLVEDGNGVVVRTGAAFVAGVDRAIHASPRAAIVLGVLGAASHVSVRSSGREWSAGSAGRLDVGVRLERSVARLGAASLGVAAVHVAGPDDVIPFRARRAGITSWAAQVAAARAVSKDRGQAVMVAADLMRLPAVAGEDFAMQAGWVGRVRVTLRHAR